MISTGAVETQGSSNRRLDRSPRGSARKRRLLYAAEGVGDLFPDLVIQPASNRNEPFLDRHNQRASFSSLRSVVVEIP